jgi:hypothetical protein
MKRAALITINWETKEVLGELFIEKDYPNPYKAALQTQAAIGKDFAPAESYVVGNGEAIDHYLRDRLQ